jgi:hypothetical protein
LVALPFSVFNRARGGFCYIKEVGWIRYGWHCIPFCRCSMMGDRLTRSRKESGNQSCISNNGMGTKRFQNSSNFNQTS